MKTNKYLFFLSLLGILFFHTQQLKANPNTTLKGTKWYLHTISEQDTTLSPKITYKTFKEGEQQIIFSKDGKYEARNLLGLDSLKGFLIEGKNSIVLSNEVGSAYYWVFEVENRTTDSLKLRFINYSQKPSIIYLTFKPLTQKIEEMVLAKGKAAKVADFAGKWIWNFDDKHVYMEFTQVGIELFGSYCYGKNCQQKYTLLGTIKSDTATVVIKNPNNAEILGAGKLIRLPDETLNWKLTKNEEGKVVTVDKIQLYRPKEPTKTQKETRGTPDPNPVKKDVIKKKREEKAK